jgi:hypothetical protein
LETLTRHFQLNYGAPYKFIVNVLSEAFKDAPDAILMGLQRLNWAAKVALSEMSGFLAQHPEWDASALSLKFEDFNELLALGYMEEDRINVSES